MVKRGEIKTKILIIIFLIIIIVMVLLFGYKMVSDFQEKQARYQPGPEEEPDEPEIEEETQDQLDKSGGGGGGGGGGDVDKEQEIEEGCVDSDGGKDYYARGYGYDGIKGSRDNPIFDECHPTQPNILREVICTPEGYITNPEYNCLNGCMDGACVSYVNITI